MENLTRQRMKLLQLDSDLEELNFNKMNIRLHLRDVYNKILKEREELLLENGLPWIIKAYWFINENPAVELFPKGLDMGSIDFILKYSKIDAELEKMTSVVKEKQKEAVKTKIKEGTSNFINSRTYGSFLQEKYGFFQKNITRTHTEIAKPEKFDQIKVYL